MSIPKKKFGENNNTYINRASKELYEDGYHISEIAQKLKCEKLYVYNSIVSEDKKIIDKEERQKIIEMRNNGLSISEIAYKCGRSKSCIRRRLKSDSALSNSIKEYNLSDKDLANLKKWYLKGYTLKYIADKLNISTKAVKYRLIKCSLWEPFHSNKAELSTLDKAKIKSMYKKGMKISQIAKECGKPYCVISRFLGVYDNY